ncbi:hypothetical protein XH92_10680 [Bradyrhizobium sp. CCBAU 53421]|nr:hypothetical protein XH92_10680 [Bradyrhizobium sp. CCBAU 53421]
MWTERMWKPLFACLMTFFVSLPMSVATAQTTKALDVARSNIVAAPRGERLLMLLNLQPDRDKLRALSADEVNSTLVETGKRYATEMLSDERYKSYATVEVIFAFVTSMDEYARPNYGGMVKIGTVSFKREGAEISVTANNLDPKTIR